MNDHDLAALKAELFAALLEEEETQSAVDQPRLVPIPRRPHMTPSFAQQRVWFFEQFEAGSVLYHIPALMRLTGHFDPDAFRHTINEVVRRHEALRTTFATVDDAPVQVIAPSLELSIPLSDLSHLAVQEAEDRARAIAAEEASAPFDLAAGPLIRVHLVRLHAHEHLLVLTMHHIIADGWSMGVLVRELAALYGACVGQTPASLAPLEVQYADFAAWQRAWLASGVLAQQLEYWTTQLAGAPALLTLKTDRRRPAVQSYRGAIHRFRVNAETTRMLNAISKDAEATLFMTMAAAFNILLARHADQSDISIGIPIANRNQPEIESLIGFFVNTLVLRTRVDDQASFIDLLRQLRSTALAAYAHQDIPFDQLVEALRPERSLSHAPVFQVMMIFQNAPMEDFALPGLTMRAVEREREVAKFDLSLYATETDGQVDCEFEYSTDLFDRATAERLASHFTALLDAIAAQPKQQVAALSMFGPSRELPPIVAQPPQGARMPLSYHQERLWFIDTFEAGTLYESSPVYHNIALRLEFDGLTDMALLETALNRIVARHQSLRTRIVTEHAQGWQVIDDARQLQLRQVECESAQAMSLALADTARPFTLSEDLLLRATVFKTSGGTTLLNLTTHHIVADRASMRLLADELMELYAAGIEKRDATLPQLPVQFSDYAHWERKLDTRDLEAHLYYWMRQLRGPLQGIELPLNRPRPAVHTFTCAEHAFALDGALAQRLRRLARDTGTDIAAVMLTGFNAMLRRYAGHDEIVVGTSAPCRQGQDVRHLIAPVANLLVLRSYLDGTTTFEGLLHGAARTYAEAHEHRHIQFDQLVLALRPEKDMSRTALFDILFQFDEHAPGTWQIGSTPARSIVDNLGYGKNDLHLYVHPDHEGFAGKLAYNADFFDPWLVEQMMAHYVGLLAAMADDITAVVDDVAILSDAEQAYQLALWSSNGAAYPDDQTLHQLIERQALATPDKVAVKYGDDELRYRELRERANQLAHHLRERGVGRATLVPLCLDRSVDMIVAMLAVLKAGAAYVPIDPKNPADRIQFILKDSGALHIVTTATLAMQLGMDAVACPVLLDVDRDKLAAQPTSTPPNSSAPTDLAYVIYTSGSTGQPKGTLLEHRNVVRLMINERFQFQIDSADVWSMFHSYAFDFTVWEIYGALLYGGCVVVVPEDARKDPSLMVDLVGRENVTVLSQTPSAFYNFAAMAVGRDEPTLAALRYVVFGGESLNATMLKAFRKRFPHVELINMYGITETCVHVTFKRLSDEDIESGLNTIGGPIPTLATYIVDPRLRLLPLGVPGEICVAGLGVGRGYLNRPELTQKHFLDNPYRTGERLYRSGDLAKMLPNGELVYLGRIDSQVKIRGFRIELGEIETALIALDTIRDAAVLPWQDTSGDKRLVAYLVAADTRQVPEPAALRIGLLESLPDYMVPAHFVFMERLPLTPNGKLDRRALPEPDTARSEVGYVAPRNDTESQLAAIWAEVLKVDQVGVNDNFFLRGGHSLLATQVISQLRTRFALDLPLRTLFEAPTVATLAEKIAVARRDAGDGDGILPAIVPVERGGALALSFAQQRLWFLDQFESGSAFYNIPAAVRLTGQLDVAALGRTVNEVVARHEALRTTFATRDGTPVQLISPHLTLELPLVDLSELPPAEREARAQWLAQDEAQTPFDLGTGPLIRVRLLRLQPDEHIALFTVHHIVSDGWSMGVLVREVAALYGAFVQGERSPLAPLAVQYADFAHWQRAWLAGDTLEGQLAYWRDQLGGAPALLALPTDRPRPAVQSFRGAMHAFVIPAATTAGLHKVAAQAEATLFMTLAAVFNILLARYAGQSDISIGTPIANRNRAETEALIGFFVNTLVLRTQVDAKLSFGELLRQVRTNALGAYAHQDVPFEQLVDALKPERHLSHSPLFQVMLALQNAPMGALALPGLNLQLVEPETATAKFDLTAIVTEVDGELHAGFEYNTDLFDASTIARMARHFTTLLDAVVAQPDARVGQLAMLDTLEREQLLLGWNATTRAYPQRETLHQLFEARAARMPDSVAVSHLDASLRYGELNARANRLAHYLRAHGVGPDSLVGICVERSFDMVVGLLAIVKAGGAYLPLDPGYPQERLAHMLDDARPVVLLTQQHLKTLLPPNGLPTLCMDSEPDALSAYRTDNPANATLPDNLAYLIYTSGSTGKPKGVSISHQAVKRLVYDTEYLPLGENERIGQAASSSFDALTFELWTALLHGAQLVIIPKEVVLSPHALADEIRTRGVTALFLTTAVFNQVAAHCPDAFASLRHLLFGGEAVDPRAVATVLREGAPARLLHVYGPTESTTFALWHRVGRVDVGALTVPLGRPITNTQVYIVDDELNPVPVGVAGHLYIAGDGLARDYLNRPELTAERFIPNPFATAPGARMYQSGDLARYLPDGAIEYLGRGDDQVKIRGLRIELGEIQARLAALPQVREAAVIVREDSPGDKRLVAYLVPHGADADVDAESLIPELRAALLQALPDYMVPAHFVFLDVLPLTPNGKIDRRVLPLPDTRRGEAGHVAPRTDTEVALCAIWAEVLKLDQVGVTDNFFLLGGHSLLATQVISQLRASCAIELPLRTLFEAPTVEQLAARVDLARQQVTPGAQPLIVPMIVPVERSGALTLSFAQQRLWFLDQFESGSAFYNIPAAVRLTGQLDVGALARTVNEIVARHEALRTTFSTRDGLPVQLIADHVTLELPLLDLSALPPAEREARAQWLAQDEAQTPFDLGTGPLIRVRLLRLQENEHIALFTVHHIVSDGWSMGVLVREVAALYGAFVQGERSPLAPLAVQYADFAHWQRQWLAGDTLEGQLAYWREQLGGAPALLALPTDRPRPAVQTFRGATHAFVIPAATTSALNDIARKEQATLFMTLAAAFNILLARYTSQSDISIGTPIANRNRAETEALIGFFVNTLVLRTQVERDVTFADLLRQVRANALGAYAHQDVPFEQLVDALKPERHLSHSPLFQVMLALQNAPMDALELPGLTLAPVVADNATAKFDITLNLIEAGDALNASFEYSTDLFEAETMARMAGHFINVLDAIVAAPHGRVGDLRMLDRDERQQLLHGLNDTATVYPPFDSLHAQFESQVAATPAHPALVFEGVTLSYAELDARANRLARALRARGVGADSLVGICVERSVEMVVGLLAILKAGGAYVPLDPGYPQDRLAYMLADAHPAVLLTQRHLLALLPEHGVPVLCLDGDDASTDSCDDGALAHATRPNNLAYVIYTSGSTGKPKGVAIDHAGIVNRLRWMQQAYLLTPQDRVLQKTPFSFDVSVWEFFWPLTVGATLVVARPGGHQDPGYLDAILAEQTITTLHFVPPMLEVFLASRPARAYPALRQVMCSGQALPLELQQRFFAALPGVGLHNLYGPTEASVDVTFWPCDPATQLACVPIGWPIANTQIHILDEDFEPVPAGVTGHLYIAGIGLARGYVNRPELTAERFVANPFAIQPGARMYQSGDLARYLADGSIEYLGRSDDQVKIRGLRIELGEIQAGLAALAPVREAAVVVREDSPGDKRLVAYLVAHDGAEVTEATVPELRATLLRSLPDYMVPAHFMFIERLPLSPNGKVDRRALPAPDSTRSEADYVAPRNDSEALLATIWADVLKLDKVGVTDNFFLLGGHSLLATQVISQLRAGFALELPLRTLFEAPTVEQLAARVDRARQQGEQSTLPAIVPVERGGALTLSFAQQRLWFLDQFESGSAFYNIPAAVRLAGQLDVAALGRTVNEVVARHEALRTTFATQDGTPVQLISPHLTLELPLVDLSELPPAEREARAQWLAQDEAQTPFDLGTGPLIRVRLLRLQENEHIALFTVHHIVSDGWSMGVLVREVAALYGAFVQDLASPLSPLAVQYADFAHWQRAWLAGDTLEGQLAYWRDQLGGAPALLALPTDRPRPAVQSFRGAMHAFVIPAATTAGLHKVAAQAEATLFMTLAAVFNILLARYAGQSDISIGTPIANRNRAETEALIGFFVNTLVLRTQVERDVTFAELLRQVRANALGAYAHQDVPFEQLVDALKPERHLSHSPLFQVMLALQNAPMGALALPGLNLQLVEPETATAKFDLTAIVTEVDGELHAGFEYNTDLFDASTIARMARHFTTLLDAVVAQPDARVGQLAMLADAEREQLLLGWNATTRAYPRRETLHQLFEARAARMPDSVAVSHLDASLRYGELNDRANRLAHYLRAHGVGPDSLVGICVERSFDMVVGLLAIVKAGGAYLPLDPGYPQERLAHMLDDARPVVLLTQQHLKTLLPPSGLPTLCMDSEPDALASFASDNLANATLPDNLAYVIYTSGSTGKPKGVSISHQAVKRLVYDTEYLPLGENERIGQAASSSFDALTFELWTALLHGAQLVIIPKEVVLSPHALADEIRTRGVTAMFLTTSVFNQAAAHCPDAFRSMRHLLVGGEALDPRAIATVLREGAPARLLNGYGPTESTTFALWHRIEDAHASTIPLGRPIANTQVYIVDDELNPVPVGVAGHLYIAGDGLARAYLNRPELTAERFIPNPFATAPGARMYQSGDLARYLPDGAIEYLGRGDDQVKIRGLRIELGEIQASLAKLAQVREAAVVVREDSPGDKRLVAYLVQHGADAGANVESLVPELRAALLQSLPDYMVPAHFVFMDSLPLTSNGKLDRRALPAPDGSRSQVGYLAPRSDTETALCTIWADVLKLDRVGVHDNFFLLGGHSLLATQVISQLRASCAIELPLRTLFEAPTVEQLAARVDLARLQDTPGAQPLIVPIERSGALTLSFAQQRLWFLDQFESGSAFYNIPAAVRLLGQLDVGALARTVNEVVARHEALRTTFATRDGTPVQLISPHLTLDLPLLDLSALPPAEREARAQWLAQDEAQTPFDLGTGPLIRVRLLRLQPDEHIALFTIHHIVSDGWSMGVLVHEVAALYGAFVQGERSPLAPLTVQYADFAHWQRAWLAGDTLESQLAYWRGQLGGAPALLTLPTDRPRPAVQSFRGAMHAFVIPAATTSALNDIARKAQATLFMTLAAAFNILLARYAGQSDISIGTPIANRNRAETEALIGFFVNTLVLRTQVERDVTFAELLRQVRTNALGAYAHQDVPFEQLVDALNPERHLSHAPLFQVMLALQNAPMDALDLPGLTLHLVQAETATAKFDLTVMLTEVDGELRAGFEYNTDLFDASTMVRMARHFVTLLDAIVAAPNSRVGDLRMLDQAERLQLLGGLNDIAAASPAFHSLHEQFEAHALATPDHAALVFDGRTLSYAELDARANRLARALRANGAGPDNLVCLFVEHCAEMVVGLLAILKAGATCLALDPDHPQQRLAYMLTDARPTLLLTRQRLLSLLPAHELPVLCLDRDRLSIDAFSDAPLAHATLPQHDACVIYTHGATGEPAGMALSHAGFSERLRGLQAACPLTAQDRVLPAASFGAEVSAAGLFWPLTVGATLVIAGPDGHAVAKHLDTILAGQAITTLHLPCAALEALLANRPTRAYPALRQVLCSGPTLPLELRQRFFAALPQLALHKLHAPTGTPIEVAFWSCDPIGESARLPVGRPIGNIRLHVLDDDLEPVPVGVIGHLYVAGADPVRGYGTRSELTAERFTSNPFPGQTDTRLFKSGDLARYLPDGGIEYLGYHDDPIDGSGQPIDLRSIEASLAASSLLRAVAVTPHRGEDGRTRILAHVEAKADVTDLEGALRTLLQRVLPARMQVDHYTILDRMPLNRHGTVDRQALPAPDLGEIARAHVAPATATELALAEIWSEVLETEHIGVHDNFFTLGGHSLLVAVVVSQIEARLSVNVPVEVFFTAQTIAALAIHVDSANAAGEAASGAARLVPLQTEGSGAPIYCIHPVGGNVFVYRELATLLGADSPVYGLQPGEGAPDYASVDEIAAAYAAAITVFQPAGPYRLLGWSSGGLLAMAIASVLEAQGHTVQYVGLLDTVTLPALDSAGHADQMRHAALAILAAMRGAAFEPDELASMEQVLADLGLDVAQFLSEAHLDQARPYLERWTGMALGADALRQLVLKTLEARRQLALLAGFEPQPVTARVHTCRTRASLPLANAGTDWYGHTEVVDGDHYGMLSSPHVAGVAAALRSALTSPEMHASPARAAP